VALSTGTSTNDSAAAGKVGQILTATVAFGSAVAMSDNLATNITSVSLTAGDWDVSGTVFFSASGGGPTYLSAYANTVSATVPNTPGGGESNALALPFTTGISSVSFGPARFSLAGTSTVYLGAFIRQSAGSNAAYGQIRARRVR
jgi:hypothetical protein